MIIPCNAAPSCDYYNIVAAFELCRIEAIYLAKAAADLVSHNGFAELRRHGISRAILLLAVFSAIDNEKRRYRAFAF